jgi:hypothetical protein
MIKICSYQLDNQEARMMFQWLGSNRLLMTLSCLFIPSWSSAPSWQIPAILEIFTRWSPLETIGKVLFNRTLMIFTGFLFSWIITAKLTQVTWFTRVYGEYMSILNGALKRIQQTYQGEHHSAGSWTRSCGRSCAATVNVKKITGISWNINLG